METSSRDYDTIPKGRAYVYAYENQLYNRVKTEGRTKYLKCTVAVHPYHMVPIFPLPHCPPLPHRAAMSTPAFSTLPVLTLPICPLPQIQPTCQCIINRVFAVHVVNSFLAQTPAPPPGQSQWRRRPT